MNKYQSTYVLQQKSNINRFLTSCVLGTFFGHLSLLLALYLKQDHQIHLDWGYINTQILLLSALIFTISIMLYKFISEVVFYLASKGASNDSIIDDTNAYNSNQLSENENHKIASNGSYPFLIFKKEYETPDKSICSFYLKPKNSVSIPKYKPGQFITIDMKNNTELGQFTEEGFYLSHCPDDAYFRITVKRNVHDALTNILFDNITVEEKINTNISTNDFFNARSYELNSVFIVDGIGITPFISTICDLLKQTPNKQVWLFYHICNSEEHIFKEFLENLSKTFDNFHLFVCYSKPLEYDNLNVDYHIQGAITVEMIKHKLPSNQFSFYLSAQENTMQTFKTELYKWGIKFEAIHCVNLNPLNQN